MCVAAGEQNPYPEAFKIIHTEGNPLQHLDLVVEPFIDAVRAVIFPAVLDIAAPVLYRANVEPQFQYFRSRVRRFRGSERLESRKFGEDTDGLRSIKKVPIK